MNQDELAIAWISKAIQINPDYIEPYISLGFLYQELGRNSDAIGVYGAYLESHGPERRILSNLALAYFDAGMPNEAVSTLQTALTIDPDDEMLHLIMAEHLYMLGRIKESSSYLAEARELDRENPITDVSGLIKMLEQQYSGISEE